MSTGIDSLTIVNDRDLCIARCSTSSSVAYGALLSSIAPEDVDNIALIKRARSSSHARKQSSSMAVDSVCCKDSVVFDVLVAVGPPAVAQDRSFSDAHEDPQFGSFQTSSY